MESFGIDPQNPKTPEIRITKWQYNFVNFPFLCFYDTMLIVNKTYFQYFSIKFELLLTIQDSN